MRSTFLIVRSSMSGAFVIILDPKTLYVLLSLKKYLYHEKYIDYISSRHFGAFLQ